MAATADGGAAIATRWSGELLRVDPAGQVTPVSALDEVLDVTALPDGPLAVSITRQVIRVGLDGSVTTLAGGGRGFREGGAATSKYIEVGDPRAADADGLRTDAARLNDVVDAQAAGDQAMALTPVPGSGMPSASR